MADVEKLIAVLHRLVDAGHSIVLIEHNLDVIAEADWIIDLGPGAGADGGRVVAAGPPALIAARQSRSHTGAALARFLADAPPEANSKAYGSRSGVLEMRSGAESAVAAAHAP